MTHRIFGRRQADTLIIALQVNELIGAINQPMRVRKISLTLDYSHKDHRPRVYIRMPGVEDQVWMITNTRTKVFHVCKLTDPNLQAFADDVKTRLAKLGGELFLVGGKNQRSTPEAKLQLNVQGSIDTALTLARVRPGQVMLCMNFMTPEGEVP